jgi:hypothetical protein
MKNITIAKSNPFLIASQTKRGNKGKLFAK